MSPKIIMVKYINWEDCNYLWENMEFIWEFVEIDNLIRRGGGYVAYVKNNPWEKLKKDIGEEKTKKVIKLWCKVNNIEYEKTTESREIKVTASDFENFIKNGISVKIDI